MSRTLRPAWIITPRIGVLLLAAVFAGACWRVARWALQFPIWGDEAYIAINVVDRDWYGLLQPLRFVQVSPILFLWAERAAYLTAGASELAMRFLPLLAGLASLPMMWALSRKLLPVGASALATAMLAASYYPVRHGCEIKSYSCDLLTSLIGLWIGCQWMRQPSSWRWAAAAAVWAPIALGFSYPALFIAGGISLAVLPGLWRQPLARWIPWTAYCVWLLGCFVCLYSIVGKGQFKSAGAEDNGHWIGHFPPTEPLKLAGWLLDTHTGNFFAYPTGCHNGGSTGTSLIFAAGISALIARRRWNVLLLLLGPFALNFIAAAMHKYPYGGSARIAQHLAPAICIGAAMGVWSLTKQSRKRWPRAVGVIPGLLMLFTVTSVLGMIRDVAKPHKTRSDGEARRIARELDARAGEYAVFVIERAAAMPANLEWYLYRMRKPPVAALRSTPRGEVWVLRFHQGSAPETDRLASLQSTTGVPWEEVSRETHHFAFGWAWDDRLKTNMDVLRFRPASTARAVSRSGESSSVH